MFPTGAVLVIGLCVALAAAGPSLLLWRAWNDIDRLRWLLADRNRRLQERQLEQAKTRAWRPDERPDLGHG